MSAGLQLHLALVFGYKARQEIDSSNGTQTGRAMATAGIVLGWIRDRGRRDIRALVRQDGSGVDPDPELERDGASAPESVECALDPLVQKARLIRFLRFS